MTKAECMQKVQQRLKVAKEKQNEDYGYYKGMETGLLQALEIFGMMQEPSLPSNIDDAAIDAAQNDMCDRQIMEASNDERMRYSRIFRRGFKAGAKWMASQGHTLEMTVKKDAGGYPYIDAIELYDYDEDKPLVKEGDKVIVNIRKE